MSSAQQTVSVKAYYNDLGENQPEIRRFTVSSRRSSLTSASTYFSLQVDATPGNDVHRALETTIAQLNSNYPQGQFTLQYVDEDNDRITFSSDSELRAAIHRVPLGGTLKIFVKPKAKTAEQAAPSAVLHEGVSCDGCQGAVVGNRYK